MERSVKSEVERTRASSNRAASRSWPVEVAVLMSQYAVCGAGADGARRSAPEIVTYAAVSESDCHTRSWMLYHDVGRCEGWGGENKGQSRSFLLWLHPWRGDEHIGSTHETRHGHAADRHTTTAAGLQLLQIPNRRKVDSNDISCAERCGCGEADAPVLTGRLASHHWTRRQPN